MKLEANSSNSNCQGWFCTIGLSDALLGRNYCSSSDNIHYVGCLGIWLGLSNFPLMCLHNHAYNHVSQRSLYFSLFQKNGIRILMWFDINVYNKYFTYSTKFKYIWNDNCFTSFAAMSWHESNVLVRKVGITNHWFIATWV